jgi:hypothetical protein
VHTKNVLVDPRVSLMIDERKEGDPLQGARIMLMGTAAASADKDIRRRYLERQPEAEMFVGFADFSFYKIVLKSAHLVAGFGRIVDLKPEDVLTPTDDAGRKNTYPLMRLVARDAESCRVRLNDGSEIQAKLVTDVALEAPVVLSIRPERTVGHTPDISFLISQMEKLAANRRPEGRILAGRGVASAAARFLCRVDWLQGHPVDWTHGRRARGGRHARRR